MIKYRKLMDTHYTTEELNSIWEYDTINKMERMIWSAKIRLDDQDKEWDLYMLPGLQQKEYIISKKRAEEIMFLENI